MMRLSAKWVLNSIILNELSRPKVCLIHRKCASWGALLLLEKNKEAASAQVPAWKRRHMSTPAAEVSSSSSCCARKNFRRQPHPRHWQHSVERSRRSARFRLPSTPNRRAKYQFNFISFLNLNIFLKFNFHWFDIKFDINSTLHFNSIKLTPKVESNTLNPVIEFSFLQNNNLNFY